MIYAADTSRNVSFTPSLIRSLDKELDDATVLVLKTKVQPIFMIYKFSFSLKDGREISRGAVATVNRKPGYPAAPGSDFAYIPAGPPLAGVRGHTHTAGKNKEKARPTCESVGEPVLVGSPVVVVVGGALAGEEGGATEEVQGGYGVVSH